LIKVYNERINDFVRDCREFIEHLKRFKKNIKEIVPIKEAEVLYYKNFVDFLIQYEDHNSKKALPGDPAANLFTQEYKSDMKDQLA
jgi:hypothetical protein